MKNCKNNPSIARYLILAAAIAMAISLFIVVFTTGEIAANSSSLALSVNETNGDSIHAISASHSTPPISRLGYNSVNVIPAAQASPFMHVIDRTKRAPVSYGHFVFHAGDKGFNSYLALGKMCEEIYTVMAKRYHYDRKDKIDFFFYTDRSKFLQESPSNDAVGYAIPSENKIAVLFDGNSQNEQSTITHEINHIIFIRSVPDIKTVPQWFIEGLAIYESHPGPRVSAIEEQALAKDLPDIISNRVDNGPAELKDYGQGYLLVGFIVSEFGREALDGIIVRLQQGDAFNDAVLKTVRMSPEELNNRSRAYVNIDLFYIWLLKLQDFEWYFATALFLLAGGLAYYRKRKSLSKRTEDERDDDDENEFDGVDFGDGAIV